MAKLNYGSGATGAVTGAATGSAFGPWGALIGGTIGGVSGLFSNSGSDSSKNPKKVSRLDRGQKKISKQLYNEVLAPDEGPTFDEIYGPYDFDKMRQLYEGSIRDPATRAFKEKTIPAITGSYRAANLHRSSLMSDALARAGRDLETDIQNQISNLLAQGYESSLSRRAAGYEANQARRERAREVALGQTTFDYERPKASTFEQIISGLGPEAAKIFSNYITNRGSAEQPIKSGSIGAGGNPPRGAAGKPGA